MAGDLADADEAAIGGGDKNFVGGVEIFRAEGLFDEGEASFGRNFEEYAAGDALEASRAERRGEDFAVFHCEDVSSSTFGDFAALVEENDFVETFFLRFGDSPNIREPGNRLDPGEGRGGVACLLAKRKAHGLAILRELRGVDDEVNLGLRFVTLPMADLVVDKIDARGAFGNLIGTNDFVKIDADFSRGVGHGHASNGSVLFEASPVALVGEGFATGDAQGGEDAPAASEAGLAGRETNLFDRQQTLIVEDVAVNHAISSALIVTEMWSRDGLRQRIEHGAVCKTQRKGKLPSESGLT